VYSVLIVDDEEPVLDSYGFMLKGSGVFSLAGKARSGFQALKLIHELEPDLVFMDINIPGLDGLEVIADVHKKFPAMVFVLSTAYERFDLAQRAIPLGVFAYLVKPVSKKTFLATLDTVYEALQSREGAEPETENQTQRFLRRTVWKAMSADEWETCRASLSLPSSKGLTLVLETEDAEKHCARLAERLSYKHHCIFDVMLNRGLLLVSGEISRDDFAKEVDSILAEIMPGGCLRGIGGLYRGPELYLSCGEALRDLENRRRQGGSNAHNAERRRIIQLRREMGIAGSAETRKLFTLHREAVFAANEFTLARAKMVVLFTLLLDDIYGSYSRAGEAPPLYAAEEIMALKDPAAWETWSDAAFEKLQKEASLRRGGSLPLPLVKAIAHIREHYADPSLQLGSAACAALVSPAHLSRLFSDHLKTNFVDYLAAFRIEQSEKLIRESGMSVKETAFAVGYQDPNYFSKIFRKLRGVSPSEFAERDNRPV
jgi:two-component system response regulator YesN